MFDLPQLPDYRITRLPDSRILRPRWGWKSRLSGHRRWWRHHAGDGYTDRRLTGRDAGVRDDRRRCAGHGLLREHECRLLLLAAESAGRRVRHRRIRHLRVRVLRLREHEHGRPDSGGHPDRRRVGRCCWNGGCAIARCRVGAMAGGAMLGGITMMRSNADRLSTRPRAARASSRSPTAATHRAPVARARWSARASAGRRRCGRR